MYGAGSCTSKGEFAACSASGTATRPFALYVHYASAPRQKLTVIWADTCSKGPSVASRSGQFNASGKGSKWIPHALHQADSCAVTATGGLSGSGWIHVWITYSRWS